MATPSPRKIISYADLRQAFAITPSFSRIAGGTARSPLDGTVRGSFASDDNQLLRITMDITERNGPRHEDQSHPDPSSHAIKSVSKPKGLEGVSAISPAPNAVEGIDMVRDSEEMTHKAMIPSRTSARIASKRASQQDSTTDTPQIKRAKTVSRSSTTKKAKSPAALAAENFSADVIDARHSFFASYFEVFSALLPSKISSISFLKISQDRRGDINSPVMQPQTVLAQPHGITATLKPYQLEGLTYLVRMHYNGMPCILGDEMGLGKTLTTLSLIQWLRENTPLTPERPMPRCLVVCPLSVLATWMSEAARFVPSLPTIRIHGFPSARDAAKRQLRDNFRALKGAQEYGLVVTSYETYKAEASWFKSVTRWTYTILDEGHRIKNESAQLSNALQNVRSDFRVILTGTPLQNNLLELWSLLHWLLPEVFVEGTEMLFRQSFNLSQGRIDNTIIERAAELLRLLMIRRTKSDVDLRLPPRKEVVLFAPLTEMQRNVYRALITDAQDLIVDNNQSITENIPSSNLSGHARSLWQRLNNLVVQLRQAAIHPYLIAGVQPDPYEFGQHVVPASTKFIILRTLLLDKVTKLGKKVIIFSGFTGVLDLVEELLHTIGGNESSFSYVRLDGQTPRVRRDLHVRRFQDAKSMTKVILISTRAGGQGINLTAATEVVFLDEDWNPQMTVQAEARAHRIGQTQSVTIYKILTYGTVEQQMLQRIRKKQYLSAKVDESSRVSQGDPGATNDDDFGVAQLRSILRKGMIALASPVVNATEIADWNMERIVDCFNEDSLRRQDNVIADTVDEKDADQAWLNGAERVQCRLFEGQTHERMKTTETQPVAVLSRADRRFDKNRTIMVGEHAVLKTSMLCGEWEAVPTITGHNQAKQPKRRVNTLPLNHQEYCMVCSQSGGILTQCEACPRVFHLACADTRVTTRTMTGRRCSQHRCAFCCASPHDAGGLLFVCRDCSNSWCGDCLEEGHVLLEDELPEFKVLGFPANPRSTYIVCKDCATEISDSNFTNNETPASRVVTVSHGPCGSMPYTTLQAPTQV